MELEVAGVAAGEVIPARIATDLAKPEGEDGQQ